MTSEENDIEMPVVNEALARRDGESDFDYHRRLVYGKLEDGTLSDVDYTELSPIVYGCTYESNSARKAMYGSLRTLKIIDKELEKYAAAKQDDKSGSKILSDLEAKRIDIQKESQRLKDQRTAFNKVIRERARQEELNDLIAATVASGNLPSLNCEPATFTASENDLMVSFNDPHYGAFVRNAWGSYDADECAAMIRRYVTRILEIAKTHSAQNCYIWANGDLISGNIHHTIAVTNRENLIEQVMGISELLAEFIAELSRHFDHVGFISVSGNHSRIDTKDRALAEERLDDLVEWYLRARMHGFTNVIIGYGDRIDPTMYVMNVRGQNYVGIHGDFDPTPSHIQSLVTMAGVPTHAVLMAHKHHNSYDTVQGVKVVMGGSFVGMDSYCVQRRIYGSPEQMVLVVNDKGIMCSYDVNLK